MVFSPLDVRNISVSNQAVIQALKRQGEGRRLSLSREFKPLASVVWGDEILSTKEVDLLKSILAAVGLSQETCASQKVEGLPCLDFRLTTAESNLQGTDLTAPKLSLLLTDAAAKKILWGNLKKWKALFEL